SHYHRYSLVPLTAGPDLTGSGARRRSSLGNLCTEDLHDVSPAANAGDSPPRCLSRVGAQDQAAFRLLARSFADVSASFVRSLSVLVSSISVASSSLAASAMPSSPAQRLRVP